MDEPVDGAPADADGGDADDPDLDEGGDRFGLAVAEAMVGVGGHGGDVQADKVTREAITSSPVSASDPSIATEPVIQAA
jgi:hypothetical protein